MPKQINTEQFHELMKDPSAPIVIDFYADWCAPCKMMLPVLTQLKQESKGKVHFYKMNVEENPEIVEFLSINSIPAFLFVSLQGDKHFHTGAIPPAVFKDKLRTHLSVNL